MIALPRQLEHLLNAHDHAATGLHDGSLRGLTTFTIIPGIVLYNTFGTAVTNSISFLRGEHHDIPSDPAIVSS